MIPYSMQTCSKCDLQYSPGQQHKCKDNHKHSADIAEALAKPEVVPPNANCATRAADELAICPKCKRQRLVGGTHRGNNGLPCYGLKTLPTSVAEVQPVPIGFVAVDRFAYQRDPKGQLIGGEIMPMDEASEYHPDSVVPVFAAAPIPAQQPRQETEEAAASHPIADQNATLVTLLRRAESFILGFEDDPDQEGVPELLADIAAALPGDGT